MTGVFWVCLCLGSAGPVVRLPLEVTGQPGRLVRLTAETTGKQVQWHLVSPDADLLPVPGGPTAVFTCPKPGRYTVLAWTALGDVPSPAAVCTVVIANATPPPVDAFEQDVRTAFANDTDLGKAAHARQLAAVYREAVGYAAKADVATAGELADRIRTAAAGLIPANSLGTVRKRIAEEIAKVLPTAAERPLDADTRRIAGQLFDRLANTLEGLK